MKTCRFLGNLFKPFEEIFISLKDWKISCCYGFCFLFFKLGRARGKQRYVCSPPVTLERREQENASHWCCTCGNSVSSLFFLPSPSLNFHFCYHESSMQVLGMNKSAYHVLHLFSFAKSLLISPHPKKTFSLTLVGAFSPPLLAWYDLRASQSCLLLRHTWHSADLGGGAAASREWAQPLYKCSVCQFPSHTDSSQVQNGYHLEEHSLSVMGNQINLWLKLSSLILPEKLENFGWNNCRA